MPPIWNQVPTSLRGPFEFFKQMDFYLFAFAHLILLRIALSFAVAKSLSTAPRAKPRFWRLPGCIKLRWDDYFHAVHMSCDAIFAVDSSENAIQSSHRSHDEHCQHGRQVSFHFEILVLGTHALTCSLAVLRRVINWSSKAFTTTASLPNWTSLGILRSLQD